MNTWKYKHTTTFINFAADEHVMIYTYRNFISTFLHTNTWQYIHTATLYELFCRWTRGNIYMLQLYINFPVDEHVMIYIDTATLYQLSCARTRDNICISQLYIYFSADEHVIIFTCRNFISTFPSMNTWRYTQTANIY